MKKYGSALLAWFLVLGLSTFTGCGSRNADTKELSERVKTPSTVPPNLSAEDTAFIALGKSVSAAFTNTVTDAQALYKIENVKIKYDLSDDVKKVVTEDEVKAKFELVLRRNNVPIVAPDTTSHVYLAVSINGYFISEGILCYHMRFSTIELQPLDRQGEWHYAQVSAWDKGTYFGTAGKEAASDAILRQVEKAAEVFANDYLAANPKK